LGQTSQALTDWVAIAIASLGKERPAPQPGLEVRKMKVKTLLLGSAAALMAAGGAQAADLTVAAPVDYVRVCDAMGTGFWYIPGTDTCLRIGGQVQFDALFENRHTVMEGDDDVIWGPGGPTLVPGDNDHSAVWEFVTQADLEVEAKSMTEWGVLTGFIQFRAISDNADQDGPYLTQEEGDPAFYQWISNDKVTLLREAYLELGFLKAGYFGSSFRGDGDYVGDAGAIGEYRPGENRVDQVLLSWAMNGFAASIGIEDPRDTFFTDLPGSYDLPVLVGVLEAEIGPFDNRLAGVIGPRGPWPDDYIAWGANAQTTIDLSSIGSNSLRLSVYFGNDDEFVDEANSFDGAFNWSGFASWRHDITSDVQLNVTGAYASPDGDPDIWEVMGDVNFDVTSLTNVAVGGGWESRDGGVWAIGGVVETEWVPDQFTTSVRARYHSDGEWDARLRGVREF
jgi:hypothetical protein